MAFKTTVDNAKCNGCEECLEVCGAGILEIRSGKVIAVSPDECIGCESCIDVCKENAITVEDTRVQLSSTCLDLLKDIL